MFKYIDLFAWIGGFRIALDSLGWKCVFTSEIDKHCQKTYKANFWDDPHGDINLIDEQDIPAHDLICAGFPCQPFSISGKMLGFSDSSRGNLFFEVMRITKYHKPKVLFLENVKGLLTHDSGRTLAIIQQYLQKAGYNFYFKILNAAYWGLPQARQRIYMVANRKDIDKWYEFPLEWNKFSKIKDILLPDHLTEHLVIARNDITLRENRVVKDWSKPLQLWIIGINAQGNRIYSVDTVGITLTATSGGVASKTGAYLVNGKVRKLHPLECRAMQGFPKNFKVVSSENQAIKQFWNAVAVPVVRAVAKNFIPYLTNPWVHSPETLAHRQQKVDLGMKKM